MKGRKISPKHIHEKASHLMHARKDGGPVKGVDEAEEDEREEPETRKDKDEEERGEAEAKHAKKGGRVKKRVGKVEGEEHRAHGGRAPRKARKEGGSCESSPFSSARRGTAATGRRLERETMD
jgi:hypothetical protein